MAEDKEILISIKVDNEAAQKSITEQTKNITDLQDANKKLKDTQKLLSKQDRDTSKERAKLGELVAKNNLKISEANKIRKNSLTVLKQEANSLGAVKANLRKAGLARDEVNLSTEEGQKRYAELTQEINNYNTTLKDAEAQGNSFKRNVGNYTNGIKDAASSMGGFSGATDGASGSFDALSKVIRLNPIGILISLLIAMVAAFAQTEEGAKKLKIIMAVLSSLFEDFISLLADGGKVIVDFFENPLESIKGFGDAIQNFVQRRVEELLKGLGQLGSAISKLFSGDFTGALEDAKKGAVNLTTSLIPVAGIVKDLAPAVEEYTKQIVANAEETVKLTTANYDLQRSLLATEKQIVKLQGQEAILASKSEDSTLSFKEQREAQEELIDVQQKRFDLQQGLLTKQVAIIQSELNLAKSRNKQTLEIEQRLNEKQKELITSRNEQRLEETNNIKIARQRDQDEWEQELDFIIDIGEKRRVKFAGIATDESKSLEVRTNALGEYNKRIERFLESQKQSFAEQGLTEDEFDRLLGIQDPTKLAKAISDLDYLTEIQRNRLKEVFIEFEDGEREKAETNKKYQDIIVDQEKDAAKEKDKVKQDEAKKDIALQKQVAQQKVGLLNAGFNLAKTIAGKNEKLQRAIAIGQAISNTALGITKAFATLPFPAAVPAALSIGATGAAQLLTIKNSDSGTGSTGGIDTGGGTTPTNEPLADTSGADAAAGATAALENAIANLGLTVSVTEINDAQNNVSLSETNSQI